ncbi:MAG: type II secretion system GspH family protein [Victivallales bacterium]|nr:type II secretion system GspH family protein [Victivallales bacterium]
MLKGKNYFSIIELITAFVIVVILMTIGVGVYRLVITKINEARTKSTVKKLEMAMRAYKHETGYYFQYNNYAPLKVAEEDTTFTSLIDYSAMKNKGEINTDSEVIDAWNNPIYYCSDSSKIRNSTLFDLGSPGKDGKWGQSKADDPDSANFGNGGDDITNTNM